MRLNCVCNLVGNINKCVDEVLTKHIIVLPNLKIIWPNSMLTQQLCLGSVKPEQFHMPLSHWVSLNLIDLRVKVLFHLSNSHTGQQQLYL